MFEQRKVSQGQSIFDFHIVSGIWTLTGGGWLGVGLPRKEETLTFRR